MVLAWVVIIVAVAASSGFQPKHATTLIALVGAWYLPWIGLMLIVLGWTHRRGTSVVCKRCDYPMVSWRGAREQCPECGNRWKEPWRACLGRRVTHRGFIAVGVSILLVGFGAMCWAAMREL